MSASAPRLKFLSIFHFAQRGRANVGLLGMAENTALILPLRRVDWSGFAVLRSQRDGGVQIAGDVGIEIAYGVGCKPHYGNQQRGTDAVFE